MSVFGSLMGRYGQPMASKPSDTTGHMTVGITCKGQHRAENWTGSSAARIKAAVKKANPGCKFRFGAITYTYSWGAH